MYKLLINCDKQFRLVSRDEKQWAEIVRKYEEVVNRKVNQH